MRALVATALLVCRAGVLALCSLSLAYVSTARDADDYTPIRFLEAVLDFQLIWSATRLVYDAAVTLFHAPLPGRGASAAIVVGEFVLSSCLTYAAGMCTLAVQVYMERDVRACDILPPGDCTRYRASALLALSASVLTSTVGRCSAAVLSLGSARPRARAKLCHSLSRSASSDGRAASVPHRTSRTKHYADVCP